MKAPQAASSIMSGMDIDSIFDELVAAAPDVSNKPFQDPIKQELNDSFFPAYRGEWDLENAKGDFRSKLQQAIEIVNTGGIGLLVGAHGLGKTRLLAETARATKGGGARYLKASKFFRTIRATYSDKTKTETQVVDELVELPLLCIDEIDKRSDTPNENALLFAVIDDRFDMGRPTLISGNVSKANLAKKIDAAILDRSRQGGGIIEFTGISYRGPDTVVDFPNDYTAKQARTPTRAQMLGLNL